MKTYRTEQMARVAILTALGHQVLGSIQAQLDAREIEAEQVDHETHLTHPDLAEVYVVDPSITAGIAW